MVSPLTSALAAAGVAGPVHTFDRPVATAQAAADVLGCPLGAIANSLVFDAGGPPVLVVASGAARVDLQLIASALGAAIVRRARPEFVLRHTGQQIGGVCPVGHPAPIRTIVDVDLTGYPRVWAGAGDEYSMFATTFKELVRITGGTALPVR